MRDAIDFIEKTIEHIEANIIGSLSLETIAEKLHFSKYHALRVFKEITDIGIMEYVSKRRISTSLDTLLSTDYDIGFIANYYGFSGKESYIKAFKKLFGITPEAYRKNPCELKIYERFNTELLRRCEKGCLIFPEIKIVPGFSIAGIEFKINAAENIYKTVGIEVAKDFFFNQSKRIKNAVSYTKYIGYGHKPRYFNKIESDEQTIYYMPSIIVNEDSIIPFCAKKHSQNPALSYCMKKQTIETKKYAVFKYIGLHNILDISGLDIFNIWEYILFIWLPTVRYKQDEYCCFELIDYELCSDEYCEISFYLSIVS